MRDNPPSYGGGKIKPVDIYAGQVNLKAYDDLLGYHGLHEGLLEARDEGWENFGPDTQTMAESMIFLSVKHNREPPPRQAGD